MQILRYLGVDESNTDLHKYEAVDYFNWVDINKVDGSLEINNVKFRKDIIKLVSGMETFYRLAEAIHIFRVIPNFDDLAKGSNFVPIKMTGFVYEYSGGKMITTKFQIKLHLQIKDVKDKLSKVPTDKLNGLLTSHKYELVTTTLYEPTIWLNTDTLSLGQHRTLSFTSAKNLLEQATLGAIDEHTKLKLQGKVTEPFKLPYTSQSWYTGKKTVVYYVSNGFNNEIKELVEQNFRYLTLKMESASNVKSDILVFKDNLSNYVEELQLEMFSFLSNNDVGSLIKLSKEVTRRYVKLSNEKVEPFASIYKPMKNRYKVPTFVKQLNTNKDIKNKKEVYLIGFAVVVADFSTLTIKRVDLDEVTIDEFIKVVLSNSNDNFNKQVLNELYAILVKLYDMRRKF